MTQPPAPDFRPNLGSGLQRRPVQVEFLEKDSYRQRRLRDVARIMPVFAGILMLLPLAWPQDAPDQSLTSSGMVYLFGLWAVVVALTFVLTRLLRLEAEGPAQTGTPIGAGKDGPHEGPP